MSWWGEIDDRKVACTLIERSQEEIYKITEMELLKTVLLFIIPPRFLRILLWKLNLAKHAQKLQKMGLFNSRKTLSKLQGYIYLTTNRKYIHELAINVFFGIYSNDKQPDSLS